MLIIHMGYPKTATTTLQNRYFNELGSDFNFLGRSFEDKKQDSFVKFILGYNVKPQLNLIKKDKINIISDELLTVGCRLSGGFVRDKKEIKENILKLQDIIKMPIKLIFTIRNQVDLLESLYVEMYNGCFKYIDDLNTPKKFVSNIKKYEGFFKWYDYYELINFFKEDFEVEIFLFEHLNDKRFMDIFHKDISEALDDKLNVRNKKEVDGRLSLEIFLINFFKDTRFFKVVKENEILLKIGIKVKRTLGKVKIGKNKNLAFDVNDKEKLFKYYLNGNRNLLEWFDEKKLFKYLNFKR